ncbi:MAG: iron ABC transporter permease [Shinella sp.]|uniref:ABC transporter permease n=1 Tax=Shinella sp. TaxID=1870904 RepID=UPI003C709F77
MKYHTATQPLFWFAMLMVVMLTVYPFGWLLYGSLQGKQGLTLDHYSNAVTAVSNIRTIWNSIQLVLWSLPIALVLGIFSAVTVTRLDIPFKRVVRVASIVAFVSPPWVAAIAYAYLMSPNAGGLNQLIDHLVGVRPFNIFSMGGMVFCTVLFLYPYVFLTISSALENIDSSYEEAAIITGCSPVQTMMRVSIPLVTPAIMTCTIFSLIMVWSLYSVPALLGMPSKIYVFATYLFFLLNGFPPRVELASAIAIMFALIAGLIVWFGFRMVRRAQAGKFQVVGGKGTKHMAMRAGAMRLPIAMVNLGIVATAIILPYLVVLYLSFSADIYGFTAKFTLAHHLGELTMGSMPRIVFNTLALAFGTALVGSVIGLVIAFYDMRMPNGATATLSLLAMFPVAVPAVAFVIGVMWGWIQPPVVLYGTLLIMVFAQVARFLPLATQHFRDGLNQIHVSLEEASRICGASQGTTLLRVSLPIIRPVVVATMLLLFMSSMRDLVTPIFLGTGTPSTTVMASRIFNMWNEGEISRAAAGTIHYIVIMGLIYFACWLILRRSGTKII